MLVLLPAILLQMFVGNKLGEIENTYQPAKIAAAEAQWSNCQPCSFSAFQIGGGNNDQTPTQVISIPHLLSILATGTWGGAVVGLNQLQKEDEKKYGPGNYIPDVFIQYWSMRVMAYLGSLIALLALWGAWLIHKGRLDRSKWFLRAGLFAVVTPFVMNTAGWLLTESGRQPWIVQGLMKTVNANSPSVSSTRHLDQPDRVRAGLHRTWRGRPDPDAALFAQGPRPRGRPRGNRLGPHRPRPRP